MRIKEETFMAKKYQKIPLKTHWLTYLISGVVVGLVILSIVLALPNKDTKMSEEYNKVFQSMTYKTSEGETKAMYFADAALAKDNLFVEISVKKAVSKINNKGLVILYIGGSWCPSCVQEVGTYSSELKARLEDDSILKEHLSQIYYINQKSSSKVVANYNLLVDLGLEETPKFPGFYAFYNGELLDVNYVVTASSLTPLTSETLLTLKTRVRDFYYQVENIIK